MWLVGGRAPVRARGSLRPTRPCRRPGPSRRPRSVTGPVIGDLPAQKGEKLVPIRSVRPPPVPGRGAGDRLLESPPRVPPELRPRFFRRKPQLDGLVGGLRVVAVLPSAS